MGETSFTTKDRANIEEALRLVKDMNGKVRRHDEEIFGDSRLGTDGLVKDMKEVKTYISNARVVLNTLKIVAGLLGLTNVGAIIVFFRAVSTVTNGG